MAYHVSFIQSFFSHIPEAAIKIELIEVIRRSS